MSLPNHRSSLARSLSSPLPERVSGLVLVFAAGLSACSLSPVDEGEASTGSEALVAASSTGSVRDGFGEPLPAVRIQLVDSQGRTVANGISAADGRYSLAPTMRHIPDGKYSLTATPLAGSGFSPRTFPEQQFARGSQLDVVLAKLVTSTISGRVLDSANNPVANQRACLGDTTSSDCLYTLADGTFTATVIPGEYTLELSGSLYQAGDTGATGYAVRQEVSASGFVSLGDFKLDTYKLRGRVTDANDLPISHAFLVGAPYQPILPGSGSWSLYFSKMVSDANGKFQLTVLPFEGSLWALSSPLEGSVQLAAGQSDVVIRLPAVHHVTGRLLSTAESPFDNRSICLQGVGQLQRCAQPSPDGTFDLAVSAGQYTLNLYESSTLRWPEQSSFRVEKRTPITVDSDDVLLADIEVETYELSGALSTSDGRPLAGAVVSADSLSVSFGDFSGTAKFARMTDAGGHFQTTVVPSSGELRSLATGYPLGTASLAQEQTHVVLTLPIGRQVTGRVVDAVNAPLADQRVCLTASGNSCTQSLSDGTFSLVVVDGDYGLELSGRLLQTEAGAWASYQISRGHPLHVDGDTALGDLKLATRALSTRVLDSSGQPLAAFNVRTRVQVVFDDFNGSVDAGGRSGTDGSYRALLLAGDAALRFKPVSPGPLPFEIEHLDVDDDATVVVSLQSTNDAPLPPCADFDGNGRVTRRDIAALRARLGAGLGAPNYRARFDLNGNGRIDVADLTLAREALRSRCG